MRGPGIPAGLRLRQPVANIDLAPTIVAAARTRACRWTDARCGRCLPTRASSGARPPPRGAAGRGCPDEVLGSPDPALALRALRDGRRGALRPAGRPQPAREPALRRGLRSGPHGPPFPPLGLRAASGPTAAAVPSWRWRSRWTASARRPRRRSPWPSWIPAPSLSPAAAARGDRRARRRGRPSGRSGLRPGTSARTSSSRTGGR